METAKQSREPRSRKIKIVDVDPILKALQFFDTYLSCAQEGLNGRISMGGFSQCPPEIEVSHAAFIRQEIPIALKRTVKKFGLETVITELAEITLPLYGTLSTDAMGCFWGVTIAARHSYKEIPAKKQLPHLAAEIGIKPLFNPILELAIAHEQTNVFSTSKFLGTHACRIGEVVSRFSYEDYQNYIHLCKKLLENGLYDWSIEQTAEKWELLTPAIKKHGFIEIMGRFTNLMISVAHIPGTKELKYKYSGLAYTFSDLLPYLIPLIEKKGAKVIETEFAPLVDFINELYANGALKEKSAFNPKKNGLFQCFGKNIKTIKKVGLKSFLDDESFRDHWFEKLT